MSALNPLLSRVYRLPFDQIRAEHVEPAIDELLSQTEAELNAIRQAKRPLTYDNSLGAFEKAGQQLNLAMCIVGHLESVLTTPELRAAYEAVQPKVSEFYAKIPQDETLWKIMQEFSQSEEGKSLAGKDPTKARLLKKTLSYFKRHGAGLDDAQKQRLSEIQVKLAEVTTKFGQHAVDSTAEFELLIEDENKLSGLPESARAAARADAESKGKSGYRFTLQYPSVMPVLTYLDDRSIREKVWKAFNTRACTETHDNRPLLVEILNLREEKAKLLGYDNFADFALEERMAKSGKKAQAFIADLHQRTQPFFERETQELKQFYKQHTGNNPEDMQAWDVGYISEKMRKSLYDFDEEELRPYFSRDKVFEGMFELVHRLYGIQVRRKDDRPTWHESVECFEIADNDGRVIGAFYADLEPRESKRAGAWMNDLLTAIPGASDDLDKHLGLICGGLTPPIGDKPALLTHREVETIFHEFGHLLHHLLTKVEIPSLAGTNVAWDFVELPSQIMENWCWEREALDLFARHYESGEAIPEELFQKMTRAKNFRSASAMMRQLSFATLDLALHIDYQPPRDGEVLDYVRKIQQQFTPATLPDDYAMVCSFLHLFSSPTGYAAGYYSYKWAEVLDADAFTAFQKEGLFNRETGTRFRESILARGDSRDPEELFRDFLGRDADLNALLLRSGLAS